VPRRLRVALVERSADEVELILHLAFAVGLDAEWAGVLGEAIEADWHHSHEDLAGALQDIRDPRSAPVLLRVAETQYPYLGYDNARAFATKCMWALHDIGTDEAIAALEILAGSHVPIIRAKAQERIQALRSRSPGDPIPAYRRARDRRVRR